MKKGVNVVVTDKENRVLVLKRSASVEFSPNLWDFPGGKVNNNETLIQAVVREAKEEAGLEVEPESKPFFIYPYPNRKIVIYAFRAKSISGSILLNEEHTEFRWVFKDDWENLDYSPSTLATLKKFFK